MGTRSKPSPSSAPRIAPTRPSIMSLGATASAPASAWLTAVRARSSRVTSFRISPPSTTPQWPCDVYSQRQTSVRSTSPGTRSRSDRKARWTMPSSSYAPEAASSFSSGMPKSRTAGTPSRCASSASSQRRSTERWAMPGRPSSGRSTPSPGQTKSGSTKSSSESRVSRASERSAAVRRKRRRRVTGKALTPGRSLSARSRGGTMFPYGPPLFRLGRASRAGTRGKPPGFPTPFPWRDRKRSRQQSSHAHPGQRRERCGDAEEPRRLARQSAPGIEVEERRLEEALSVPEGKDLGDPAGRLDRPLGHEPDEYDRQGDEEGDEHSRARLARDRAEQDAEGTERGPCERQPDGQKRQPLPGLTPLDPRNLGGDAEDQRQRESHAEGDERSDDHLRRHELDQRNEPARQPADDVLVAFRGDRAGGEQDRDEGEREREGVGLELRRQEPGATRLAIGLELDGVRRRAKGLARLPEGEEGFVDERGEVADSLERLGVVRPHLELVQHLGGLLEAHDVELVPEELRLAALDEQLDVREVGGDVRLLEKEVEAVDERLRGELRPAGEPALPQPQNKSRALHHPAELSRKATGDDDGRDHLARLERALGLLVLHRNQLRLVVYLADDALDVEALARDGQLGREIVEVDEGDPRPVAREADQEPDQNREEQRVEDERAEEDRRAPEHAQVLAHEEPDRRHAKTSADGSASYWGSVPSKTMRPSSRTATRSAKRSSSSRFWVTKTTAPPRSRTARATSQKRRRWRGSSDAVASSRRRTSGCARSATASSSRRRARPLGSGTRSRRAKSSRFSRGVSLVY